MKRIQAYALIAAALGVFLVGSLSHGALDALIDTRIAAAQLFQPVLLNVGTPTSPVAWPFGSTTSTDPHYGVPKFLRAGGAFTLQSSVTKAADFSGTAKTGLGGFDSLIVTLDVTSAERDSADETYDFYITTGDGVSSWDVAHFPQIATTGAKRYTAVIAAKTLAPVEVTTATPGVSAVMSGTLKTDTAGAGEGIKTLGAGKVRHGVFGDRINHELVVAGTIATGIAYSVTVTTK